ncbi:MAG: PAS domain-containing protein [Pseudomonadota bacterium]
MPTPPGPDEAASSLQDALRLREPSDRLLAENIPVQIWTALPNGHLDYVTEQTATRLGLTAAELLRDGWQNVVHPDDLGIAVERWMQALTTGEGYEVEFRLRLASGSYAWHLARAIAQRSQDGRILRWLGTNTNIDELREGRRRVQALLDEVVEQAREQAVVLEILQRDNAVAQARIAELEAQLRKQ